MEGKKESIENPEKRDEQSKLTNGYGQTVIKNATLKDLEKATGVSKSTISRVFNNPDKVKSSTMRLVKRKAEELGYQPSRVAQRLQAGRGNSKVIGLIIPDISNPFFSEITRGIEDVALSNGYALIFNNSNEDPDRQRQCLDTLRMEKVDGIILPPVSENDIYVREMIERGLNIVCIDRILKNSSVDTILSDNKKGAYIAVSHLIKIGHKRIAYIGGIPDISTTRERRDGYKEALLENGIEIDPALILEGDSKQVSGEKFTRDLLAMENPPTAVFTVNNMTTLGVYVACNRLGAKIPDDLAIVGYDDVPWADALMPPPTVIDQSTYDMGRKAAEMLLARIKNPESIPVKLMIEPNFIIRQSCGQSNKND